MSGVASPVVPAVRHQGLLFLRHCTEPDEESGHVHSNRELCGDSHTAVQEFRCEIRAVLPYDRVQLGVQFERSEHLNVAQWLEHGALELVTEIYFTFETIAETEMDYKVSNPPCFGNSDHFSYSKGEMGFKG